MRSTPTRRPGCPTLRRARPAALLLAGILISGCGLPNGQDAAAAPTAATGNGCPPAATTVLHGELHGALRRALSAGGSDVACQGMPRPAARGIRLQFRVAAEAPHSALVMIIGIDGVARGDTGKSIRSTVTVIDERDNRFFSTGTQPSCFSDIEQHRDRDAFSDVSGVLWCTAAIPEVNGQDSIRVTELRFAGRVTWPAGG